MDNVKTDVRPCKWKQCTNAATNRHIFILPEKEAEAINFLVSQHQNSFNSALLKTHPITYHTLSWQGLIYLCDVMAVQNCLRTLLHSFLPTLFPNKLPNFQFACPFRISRATKTEFLRNSYTSKRSKCAHWKAHRWAGRTFVVWLVSWRVVRSASQSVSQSVSHSVGQSVSYLDSRSAAIQSVI